jgi:dethiobiotin synthetase
VSASRPDLLVVVVGTGTEVGKTWVAAHALRDLRAEGHTVAARKPAQSFGAEDRTTDAHVLGAATGEEPTTVCPRHRWYTLAMAPPMAADALGRPAFAVADLAEETVWSDPPPAIGLVETAGGVRSPQAADGDAVALVEQLEPDLVVLVADAGLGTINAVRLTLEAVDRGAHVAERLVVLNRYEPADDLHRRNREWLEGAIDAEVLTSVPALVARLRP